MASLDIGLVADLVDAVESDSLVLHYQPEVDLASGAVVGMEALLRWQHPRRGLLWPADFLAVAEAAGLAIEIGDWVLQQCVAELVTWRSLPPRPDGEQRRLWLNLWPSQLADVTLADRVRELVGRFDLEPGMLGLEVTEQALEPGTQRSFERLAALRAAGASLAVDDFGTWYSSLATLGELPVDAVKLDQTFVRGVGSDLEDDDIVASVIRLAHAHGIDVVAEGVESWAEGARLCELGCDRAIGFLFSGPQPAQSARWMLTRGTGWRGDPRLESVGAPTGERSSEPRGGRRPPA